MPMDGVERRLAAILSADVVGYSRLMAEDQEGTVRLLATYREEIALLVGQHGGRLVDFTGDNFLAEFPSARAGVECALETQAVLVARNSNLAADRKMEFRMGIHLGDVQVEGERIFGDGVNIASRLEGLAQAGGVCISGAIHDLVESRADLRFDDLGEQAVKNIPRPVRVFSVRSELRATTKIAAPVGQERPSIVVLPFADMSPKKDQEYFCDGMAEEVINALNQLEGLHVVARTSAFSFKGRDVDIREIGNKLGVRSVLEGSVRKAGDRLRVTAQLVNVEDGFHLWSDRFDRRLDDVFAIQDEISAAIAAKLETTLVGMDRVADRHSTANQEAYDRYLRGRFHWEKRGAGIAQGLEYFRQALELDPDYALAHAGVADVYSMMGLWGLKPAQEVVPLALEAARKAVARGPRLAETYTALGMAHVQSWESAKAECAFKRALEINPSHVIALSWRGLHVLGLILGRSDAAIESCKRACELDPLSSHAVFALGMSYWVADRPQDAVPLLEAAVEREPFATPVWGALSLNLTALGRHEEAIASGTRFVELSNRQPGSVRDLGRALCIAGRKAEAEELMRELEERAKIEYVEYYDRAVVALALGDVERALDLIESSLAEHETKNHGMSPALQPLQGNPRFESMRRLAGLTKN